MPQPFRYHRRGRLTGSGLTREGFRNIYFLLNTYYNLISFLFVDVISGRVQIKEEDTPGRPPIPGNIQIILDPADPVKGTVVEVLGKASESSIRLDGTNHDIRLYDAISHDASVVRIDTDTMEGARLRLGGGSGVGKKSGFLSLLNKEGNRSVILDGSTGKMVTQYSPGKESIIVDATGSISIHNLIGQRTVYLAGNAFPGLVLGSDKDGFAGFIQIMSTQADKQAIWMDGIGGSISLYDGDANEVLRLDPAAAADDGKTSALFLGAATTPGKLVMRDRAGKDSIIMDGAQGDIFLNNADCAEDFDVSEPGEMKPGTVMVIEEEGKLHQSMEAYDKKVAGVISGAGDCKPGIVLDKKHSQVNRKAVALMGKVYCKVDAQSSSIEVGDLLTTSSTPGHAMKAADPLKSFGAVIGKALRPLKTGKGLIPILVALQ